MELAGLDDSGVMALIEASAGYTLEEAPGPRPCHLPGYRRQSVLRERDPPPPRKPASSTKTGPVVGSLIVPRRG